MNIINSGCVAGEARDSEFTWALCASLQYPYFMQADGMPQIGPYTITRELGRGGMGVVYLARDARRDRDVAIKALPEHLASDPDRLARFQREAKVLASLNHPSIGAIYGIEEANGQQYLVLEYIEGETLDDALSRGPLPVNDAVEIAVKIAEALEVAHEKGVIHRDLKPGNIMVTADGAVKVLDFGLARTTEATSSMFASDDSPTMTSPMPVHSPTIPGAILGTAGYMSPERARGKPVDKRSDIFAFGCVLYEMLTGVRPFHGETVADSIGATLHKDVDLVQLPAETPAHVRRVLRNCLEKNKRDRLHDIADARIELARADDDEPRAATASTRGRMGADTAALIVMLIGLAAAAVLWRQPPPLAAPASPLVKFATDVSHIDFGDRQPYVCISPDGTSTAYGSGGRIGIRRIDQFRLESGTRITIVHVPDATKQVMLTWLPIGLMGEPAGYPNMAKVAIDTLLPAIDAPDPDVGLFWFATSQAEDTTVHSWGPPEDWRELIEVHRALFEPATLHRQHLEQGLANARRQREVEERANMLGLQSWYQVGAWNQVVRHKKEAFTPFAPLSNESFHAIQDWLRPQLGMNEHVDIATIGPVDPALVRDALEKAFGKLPRIAPTHTSAIEVDERERIESRWPLPDRLVMHWRVLPDDSPASRALAELVRLRVRGLQAPAEQVGSRGSVSSTHGRVYLVTGSLLAATDFKRVLGDIEAQFDALREPSTRTVQEIMSEAADQSQLHEWPPDFARLRLEPPHGSGESAEWDWLSSLIGTARHLGVEPLQVSGVYRNITAEDVVAFCSALAEAPSRLAVVHSAREEADK